MPIPPRKGDLGDQGAVCVPWVPSCMGSCSLLEKESRRHSPSVCSGQDGRAVSWQMAPWDWTLRNEVAGWRDGLPSKTGRQGQGLGSGEGPGFPRMWRIGKKSRRGQVNPKRERLAKPVGAFPHISRFSASHDVILCSGDGCQTPTSFLPLAIKTWRQQPLPFNLGL